MAALCDARLSGGRRRRPVEGGTARQEDASRVVVARTAALGWTEATPGATETTSGDQWRQAAAAELTTNRPTDWTMVSHCSHMNLHTMLRTKPSVESIIKLSCLIIIL